MVLIALILLFVGAVLMAVGANVPQTAAGRIGTVLLAIGFGIQLFTVATG